MRPEVGVAVFEEKVKQALLPFNLVIVAVTELVPVLNLKPEGTLKTMVPSPISLFAHSAIVGPTNVV